MLKLLFDLHDQYKKNYLWKFKKEAGIPTSECVWNSKLYAKEVHGIVLGSFGWSAYNGWLNIKNTFDPKKWIRVVNTPTAQPKKWDIIFFWKWMGKYWHVAIFDGGNLNYISTISQNSTGAEWDVPGDEIKIMNYTYKHVVGWYSPIV